MPWNYVKLHSANTLEIRPGCRSANTAAATTKRFWEESYGSL
jgi:hypothetical protein